MKTNMCIVVLIGMIFTTKSFSQNLPNYVPQNGLEGYWSFEGDSKDLSVNQNHGKINGVNLVNDKSNKLNSAIEFNGNGNFIGFDKSFFGGKQINSFTFFTRINFKDISNSPNIWGKTLFWGEVNFMVTNIGEVQFAWANSITGNKYSYINSLPNQVNINTWYDISFSFENGNAKIYLDGKELQTTIKWIQQGGALLSEKEIEKSCNFEHDLGSSKLGVRYVGGSEAGYLNGIIDEFGIWNRSLNPQEITFISNPCQKQTASSTSLDKIILKNDSSIILSAFPIGGKFVGGSSENNTLNPAKSKLGKNHIDYVFKNESGCEDTTRFNFMVYDTLGVTCTKLDTITIKKEVFDTVVVNKTKYDTITIKNTIFDTITIKNTIYDTVSVTKNIYDTIVVKTNVYDTIKVTNTVTLYDTIVTKTTVTDTLKIKVGITTGLYVNQVNLIKIFPNPTASDLVIDFGNQEMMQGYSLTITDLNGKQVHKESIQTPKSIIKLSSLGSKGIYFVNILDQINKVISVKQIVLE